METSRDGSSKLVRRLALQQSPARLLTLNFKRPVIWMAT